MIKTILVSLLASIPSFAANPGWTQLTNTRLSAVCPNAFNIPGTTGCGSVVHRWSGAAADTSRNRLIIWGGGHNDYYGNEVYSLDLSTLSTTTATQCGSNNCRSNGTTLPTLTRLNDPGPPADSVSTAQSACVDALSDGTANGRHTYNGLTYIPAIDSMLVFGGGHSCRYGGFFSDLWTLGFSGMTWTQKDPVSGTKRPGDGFCVGCGPTPQLIYDPNKNLSFLVSASTLWTYNHTTNTYQNFGGTSFQYNVAFDSTPALDTKRHVMYYFGGGAISKIDISGSTYTWQNITSSVSGCNGLIVNVPSPGVAYDTVLDKIVGWPNSGNTVYIFDPTNNTCTTQTFSGGPPDEPLTIATGTYGRFQYFPALDAFVLVNSPNSDAYMLRLSSSAPPPPSIPVISSFTTSSGSISAGSSATLSWTTSGATSVSISPGPGTVALSGSATVTPTSSTTYTLTATNSAGSVTATAAITVTSATPPPSVPVISLFTTSSASITAGSSATLSWTTSGAASTSISPGPGSVALSGTATVAPASSTTYTLTATNSAGSVTATTTITVTSSTTTPPASSGPTNTLTLTNSGATVSNYPVQIGRPFVQGEIPSAQVPQAYLGSTALPTQTDVKGRWPDGSLKHAVISFLLPAFAAGQSYTITLKPGSTVGNTPLTQAQMLAAGFDFDAQMQLTNGGVTKTASARAMLTNGDYQVWASGPIATTIILGDHAQGATCGGKAASAYDFGFDSFCAFRPLFHATFWPTTNQVFVRYIGEIANTVQAEDITGITNIVLTIGNTSPTTVYSLPAGKAPLSMRAWTRWTKTFWLNGTPPASGINHNLPYLVASYAVPSFDTTRVIPAGTLTSAQTTYAGLDTNDPYSRADFTLNQSAAAARNYPAMEIAPISGPLMTWIYTGDSRPQAQAIRYAELASAWPVHFREGLSGRFLDRAHTVDAKGHWLSVSARPSIGIEAIQDGQSNAADRITPVGTISANSWIPETGHYPNWTLTYYLTGDYYFLEENWAWASWAAATSKGYRTNDPCGRGPTGVEGNIRGNYGGICGQTREQAWVLRQRVETAFMSPDSSPERSYYDLLVRDAIAAFEAIHEVANSQGSGYTTMWNWAHKWGNADCSNGQWIWCNYIPGGVVPTTIPQWESGSTQLNDYPESAAFMSSNGKSSRVWMEQWVILALGRAGELGYSTDGLLAYIGPKLIQQVTDAGWNPYLLAAYTLPTSNAAGTAYETSWSAMKASVCSSTATGCVNVGATTNAQTATTFDAPINRFNCAFNPSGDGACGAAYFPGVAASYLTNLPNGSTLWNFMKTNAMSNSALNGNPMWAIVPRSTTSSPPPPPPTMSACDLNSDGLINGSDVQSAIDQALGKVTCGTADLQHNNTCDVVDVQRVINASMGGACVEN